ncbi:MAG: archaellin/type IV pilin N-terminal domain-containing protein [archaeon]
MILKNKKGLSPVIATTLLILIAVIIALIIFLWVKAFIGEKIQKDLGAGPEAIENFCGADQLVFSANAILSGSDLKIELQNSGNIPIQGIQVARKGLASVKIIGNASFSGGPLTSGDDSSLTVPANGIAKGNSVRVVAVLLGILQDGSSKKEYACSNNYVEVVVS